MTDPVRLLADPDSPAVLQADLTALREHPVSFDVDASLASFEARLQSGDLTTDADDADLPEPDAVPEVFPEGADSVPHAEPSGTVPRLDPTDMGAGQSAGSLSSGTLSIGKVLAVLALGAGVGLGALRLARPDPASNATPPSESTSALPAERFEEPDVAPARSSLAAPKEPRLAEADVPSGTPEPPPPAPRKKAAPATTLPAEETSLPLQTEAPEPSPASAPPASALSEDDAPRNALQREVAQLGEIRKTLGSNPRRALELANRGHVEFQAGSLYQEREALALRALRALGDEAALESRGRAFLLRYPKSSFAREVERMLAE